MPFENPPLRVVLFDEKHDRRSVLRSVVDLALGAESVVAQASSVVEAVGAVASKSANAIVLEIQMSGGRGIEAISALRAAYPSLTIAVCSFSYDRAIRLEANLAGADVYLVKPVGVGEIRSLGPLVNAKEQPLVGDGPPRRGRLSLHSEVG